MHRFIEFIRRLIDAFRHVRSGGKTTKARAQRRVARPASCPTCHQPTGRQRACQEEYRVGARDVDDHHDCDDAEQETADR